MEQELVRHRGGCHCGRVAFEFDAPVDLKVSECNCSMCSMTGFLHVIVPADRFRLLRGRDELASYRFNTGTADHLFCRVCGVKSFYVPRSHPGGFSVNLRCMERGTVRSATVTPFDGRNWQASIEGLRRELGQA